MTQMTLSKKDIEEVLEYKAHEAKTYEAEEQAKDTACRLSNNYDKRCRIYDYIRGMTNDLPKMSQMKTEKAAIARNKYKLTMATT